MKEKTLDLRKVRISGNVLDLGYKDYGIIYNLCKRDYSDMEIDYLNKPNKEVSNLDKYENCILFFSLKNMWTNLEKKEVLDFIYNSLEDDGELYIWDVDKSPKKVFNYKIKIIISDDNIRFVNIMDYNLINNNSKESIIKLIKEKFDIIDFDYNDEIFFIKAKKKGC